MAYNTGDGFYIPGWGWSPGGGHGNLLQDSWLENPMDRGAWQATVDGVAKRWTWLKWLSTHTLTHTHTHTHTHTAVLYSILVEVNLEELRCGPGGLYSWISVEPLEIVLPSLVCLRNGGALLRHFHVIAKLQLVWILLTPVDTIFTLLGKIPEFPSPNNFKDLTGRHDWDFWSWDNFIAIRPSGQYPSRPNN